MPNLNKAALRPSRPVLLPPWPLLIAAWVAAMAQPINAQQLPYREARPRALAALRQCSVSRQPPVCEQADLELKQLIAVSERPQQRALRPRCLSALALVETQLATFRWGTAGVLPLERGIDQAEANCSPPG